MPARTITLRLDEEEAELVGRLCDQVHELRVSRALLVAARRHGGLVEDLERERRRAVGAQNELARLRDEVREARYALRTLAEFAAGGGDVDQGPAWARGEDEMPWSEARR